MKIDIKQLEFIDSKLRKLLVWLESTGLEFTITSLYRVGDSGVHGQLPVRGADLRMRNRRIGAEIVDYINEHWQYDYTRAEMKCAIIHGKDSNQHIHIQVHGNTK